MLEHPAPPAPEVYCNQRPRMDITEHLARLPKAELHLHMEGAIRPETLLLLAERNRIRLPFTSPEQLDPLLNYREFRDFIRVFLMFVGCLRRPEDFAEVILRLGAGMNQQNIRYAEITWTPQLYLGLGIPLQAILDALNHGRTRARSEWGVEMRWIPDLVRSVPGPARQVVDWLCSDAARDCGVVALGLGGPEAGYPAAPFAAAFARARDAGLASNPHAGENAGPESVREALRVLGAQRLGHGVRSIEDDKLVAYLAAHQVALEVCPTSNLRLGVYPSYGEHPLKRLVAAGCRVTINSDDPVLFGTTLTDEYRHAVSDCGLTIEDIERSILAALAASYLPDDDKRQMTTAFQHDFAQLRAGDRPVLPPADSTGFA